MRENLRINYFAQLLAPVTSILNNTAHLLSSGSVISLQ